MQGKAGIVLKMKHIAGAALGLVLLSGCAFAQSTPMTDYAPGQMIDVGFARPVQFMAGCVLEGGEGFMLVDSDTIDGHLLSSTGRVARDHISNSIPIPDGYSAQLTAQDQNGCVARIFNGQESHTYTFACEMVKAYEYPWKLRGYVYENARQTFSVKLSHDRLEATQTTSAGTQAYTTFYQFFVEANNVDYGKIPRSIDDMKRMEKEYPVAAVSPQDPGTRVNLRKGPSTKTERVGSLYSGARLHIREITDDGWAKIYVGDTDAYISTEFLTFGEAIEHVEDARPYARIRDGEWIEISRAPYRGGGGTVAQTQGGQDVRIIGEYNSQWRIVGTDGGSYYIDTDNLR